MTALEGETALITGAGRGIGLAFAAAYKREGARVAPADIDFATAAVIALDIKAKGGGGNWMS